MLMDVINFPWMCCIRRGRNSPQARQPLLPDGRMRFCFHLDQFGFLDAFDFQLCIERQQCCRECGASITGDKCPATVAVLRMLSGASSFKADFNASGQSSDSSKLLQSDGAAPIFEVVSVSRDGIQVEGLQIHNFNGICCRLGKKRAASKRNPVGLSQKRQGFFQCFGSMIGGDHMPPWE